MLHSSHFLARGALAGSLAAALAGCAVGPDYVRPAPPAGATLPAFKEEGPWRAATPSTIDANGAWWRLYGDPQLDALVEQAMRANQTVRQAEAQYRAAQALVQGAQSAFYPDLGLNASENRARTNTTGSVLRSTHASSLAASWEPDLWGRVRRSVEQAGDGAQASAADLAGARLTIQAALASSYFQLRVDDQLKDLYARTIEGYRKTLQLTQSQHRAGIVTRADVASARATLAAAEAQALDVNLSRQQLEHAIALLLGKTPAEFSLAPAPIIARLPAVPVGLPSELLQRRPDIAGAERRMAAANAAIGVAQAAWYPSLSLGASAGFMGAGLGPLFSVPDRVWALGATLAATLFDGGLRRAQSAQARAGFDAAAAAYRQTVLAGFQEVEDNLAALRELEKERDRQEEAVQSSREAERMLLAQYRAGTTPYTTVITAQATRLATERTAMQLAARQFTASVTLVKAVGGGWDAEQLPAPATDTSATATAASATAQE
ncbi:efflux transporter outer membrane subunit [Xylophilus sp. ASV27]|uniref:efflux transporter outer membrane subunit n=1 Tax=Xylophilus sp. ASV27 TaxID=2795129 RepID=UPI0018ECCE3D|nr:efflux transporter outer membrane subunit [Xylophilus sp. ASV27]